MAELSITTELDNRAFVPGDRLRGEVAWSGLPELPEEAELRLFYYTSGKGTRDLEIVERQHFDNAQSSDQRDFEFHLPPGPPSFSGKLVSLTWALELVIEADGEISERLEFQLSATGKEIDLYTYADANAEEFLAGKKPWFNFTSS